MHIHFGGAMQASILDLRYKMKDVLKALDRNEVVEILYHGKLKGIITPYKRKAQQRVKQHPFFGMSKDIDVTQQIDKLRGGRYRDI